MRIESEDRKKTTLSDDSLIYKKREEKSTKARFKELNRKEKWQFFKDYILGKLLLTIVIGGFLIYMLITIFGPKPDTVLYTAIFSNPFSDVDIENVTAEASQVLIDNPDDQQVILDTGYTVASSDAAGRYKFVALLGAGEIDTLICPKTEIQGDVDGEAIYDLREILPADLYKRVEPRLLFLKANVYDYDEDKVVVKESAPYAVDISDFIVQKSSYDVNVKYYYSFIVNDRNLENGIKFLEYIIDTMDGVE